MESAVSNPEMIDGKFVFHLEKKEAPPPAEARGEAPINTNVANPLSEKNFRSGTDEDYKEFLENKTGGKTADEAFPAGDSSLHVSTNPPSYLTNLEWKQTQEISKNPHFMKGGAARDDIMQGVLSDCWFLSSVASICRTPRFFKRVVPPGQKIEDNGSGHFYFRFWKFGEWIGVVVDDNLPTKFGQLVYGRCRDPDEFWLPLIEKAFAKFHGSYEALEFGQSSDALENLTGGIAVAFNVSEAPKNLFPILKRAMRNRTFACCDYHGQDKLEGLVSKHAYTITGAKEVNFRGSTVKLLRIRNPWGRVEWTGDWSDSSALWDELDPRVRQKLGHANKDEGEFWMSFGDFMKHFDEVKICTVGPDFDKDGRPTGDKHFLTQAKGAWILNQTDGGCKNNVRLYTKNPQFLLHLREADDFEPGEDDLRYRNKCSVIIGLMQEDKRHAAKGSDANHYIKTEIYKVSSKPAKKLDDTFFYTNLEVGGNKHHSNVREAVFSLELDPGYYVIIPSTFNPGKATSFLLRIFTEKQVGFEEIH